MEGNKRRTRPNILITGTPGTGKTTLSHNLAEKCSLNHIELSSLIKEKSLHSGWDEEFECYILDEDKVLRSRHLVSLTAISGVR